ncbi:MAG: 16S rRNA (cytosine(967)-C(5))-methyltransferase RsmB [Acidobacteriota bacterium]|nr:16S rRNA (cytosine(967)-C(5))-methyltransferase RsmB [Acidobacteriota bacterium]
MKISPARLAAFEILGKIEREKAFSSVLLPLYEEKLAAKDRALCHTLTLGVLRKKNYLDRLVQAYSKTKISKLDAEVLNALRLALYQMLFLDKIPDFSAINESVNLVQKAKKTSAKSFVNAVLRRATREKPELKFTDEVERVSIETSHPRWLVENWIRQFGFEETEKLAKSNNETPPLVFRLAAKADEKTAGILKKLGVDLIESEIVPNAWRVEKTSEMLFAYANEGRIYFQEESSQLVAETVNLEPDESFLDVCAAPGSKATFIAGQRSKRERRNLLVGGDLYEHRLRFLKQSAANQGVTSLNLAAYDAENALPFADEAFDAVLLDAPCSGTGTIRHNPEIRYFLAEKDFAELSGKQLAILKNASKTLKKGGRLIYSTCSLERVENETVIENFLAENAEFEKAELSLKDKFLTREGFARTFPQRDDTDGFFIAALRKR